MNEHPKRIHVVREFEPELGVPAGFFERLYNEDDWSFVIKLHALIEAAATKVLVECLNKPELRDYVARAPLSGAENGKLPMMKALGIGDSQFRGFIRKLSELRNQLLSGR